MAVTTKRSRSIAHRWGPVCPSLSSADESWALGIRFDEEDDAAIETFVVRLSPGKTEIVDQLPGNASALAVSSSNKVFVLDERGQLVVHGRRHKLASPRALTWCGDGVVLAGADRLWLFSADGADVREGPPVKARRIAASAHGVVAALDDGTIVVYDDLVANGASARGRPLTTSNAGHVAVLAIDDGGNVVAANGKSVLYGGRDSGVLETVATAPFEVHAIAVHHSRVLVSSRAHGLFSVELEHESNGSRAAGVKGIVMPLRPSLRAHTLAVRNDQLVVASDLFVATASLGSSDGVDFATRDLGPFVRQAEQRVPRFHSSEDPLTV